jgi:NADPH-dependent curcumin reductase CurA
MQGFIVLDHMSEAAAAQRQLVSWLGEGKLKRQETIVKGGLKVADTALMQLFRGENIGRF